MKRQTGIQLEKSELPGTYRVAVQVVRDVDGKISQGIVVGNTLSQNKALIIVSHPGEFCFNPTVGAGISDLLLDDDYLAMATRIQSNLVKDRMTVSKILLLPNKPFELKAEYE